MIFVDSNIPMYLVGTDHPNKHVARRMLEAAAAAGERIVTDAEVLLEILHRYASIRRRAAIADAFEALLGLVDEVFPVDAGDVLRAKRILLSGGGLSARDSLHVAVMQRHDVGRIMSFDRGFDGVVGIERLGD